MQKITVSQNEAGQRLDKLLAKYLSAAPKSFFYKMLRKKNIKLNGKKAEGNEKLTLGDTIELFLSDETIEKFTGNKNAVQTELAAARKKGCQLDIIYEDSHVLLLNKPAGMLSQKADNATLSINEYMIAYLLESGQLKEEELKSFKPAICNRLDRNTSGLVAAGKSLAGLQQLGEMFRERTMEKYYLTIVNGVVKKDEYICGYLKKDERTNKVTVLNVPEHRQRAALPSDPAFQDAQPIETAYHPLATNGNVTLLEVHLITGRTHQIRAHLASKGHAIIGDSKYGSAKVNAGFKEKYRLNHQLLHAWRMVFPETKDALAGLSGSRIYAPLPKPMLKIIKGEHLSWEPGTQED